MKKLWSYWGFGKRLSLASRYTPSAMQNGMPRNTWFNQLLNLSENKTAALNIAVHVNYDWCSDFCKGKIAPELSDWLRRRVKNTDQPLIKRWQLNIGDETNGFDEHALAKIISDFQNTEFIFIYNEKCSVQESIEKLDKTGAKFSLLFDSSYGYGITPKNWSKPIFDHHPQGYAGGLCGENVIENMDKISKKIPKNYETWVDAEGKLMKPGTRKFDLDRAQSYIRNVLKWLETNNIRN